MKIARRTITPGVPAVAMADAFLATSVFSETGELPKDSNHPLYKLFPEFVDQLKWIS